jgi:hypothetical protein
LCGVRFAYQGLGPNKHSSLAQAGKAFLPSYHLKSNLVLKGEDPLPLRLRFGYRLTLELLQAFGLGCKQLMTLRWLSGPMVKKSDPKLIVSWWLKIDKLLFGVPYIDN